MPSRTLSESEFNAIKEALLRQAPDGLSEEQFNRWFTPRFDGAIAEAEHSREPVSGGSLRRFIGNAAAALNPVSMARGLAQTVAHPVQAYNAAVDASAEQFVKASQAPSRIEAAGHTLAGIVPFIGPAAANVGEQVASGDVAGGIGSGAGLVTAAAATGPATRAVGKAVKPVTQRISGALYQSALKPTKAVLKDVRTPAGSGPDAARQTLITTGLREGIPVSPRGAQKAGKLIDSLNAEVQARLSSATQAGKTVDPALVEAEIRNVARDFTTQVNAQPDLAAIETVRHNFATNPQTSQIVSGPAGSARVPKDLPVAVAQQMKTNTYQGLRGKYGVERSATIEAEKAGARGLRQGIEQAAPEVAALNAREGAVIPLEEAIADAMRRRGNYGIFGLTPVVASIPAIATGNPWPLLAALTDRMPGVVSRTGIWLNRTGSRSGRVAQRAGQAGAVGATSPSESRRRTTAPAWSTP